MYFNIWTSKISVAFKIIVFTSYTCMLQIYLFKNLYFIYLYVILIFFVFILKADERGE